MDIWQKKGGTPRDQERSSWSNRDADSQSFDRSDKRGIGGQYKGYSVSNQTSRKETTIFAKPNEPYYKNKQDYSKDAKFDRNVPSRSHDDNPNSDSFSLLNRSSFSKAFDYRSEKIASEAYGKSESLGNKRYIAQDISDFDIEPYAVQDKNLRRDSYSLQDRKISSGPYNSLDRKVNSGPYIAEDRKITGESYRPQVSKLGVGDRTMSQRHQIAQDDSFGSVTYKSHNTFSGEPFSSQQEKVNSRTYHSRDSYLDTREKNLGNAPSQSRSFSGLQVTHERNVDGRPYELQATSLINEPYISKDIHSLGKPYNTLDKKIGERSYASENVNLGEVPYSIGDRKYNRGPDNSLYRNPREWHQDIEGNQIKIRSQRPQDRDLATKPYTFQDRRPASPLYSSHETSLRNISYISQDRILSSRNLPSQGRKLDSGPYNSQERTFTSEPSYAEEINSNKNIQEITPSSRPYYLQDKTINDRTFISQDRSPRVSENPFPSSSRTFYSSKSRDEPLTERKAFITQGQASYVNELDENLQQFNKQPITYANKPVSNNIKPLLYHNEPQSYGRKPAALVDGSQSYDTRPKLYDNCPSVETERLTFMGKTRSSHEKPGFRDVDKRSGDNIERSFDNRPERFEKKLSPNDDTLRSLGDKLRSYDNRTGLRDKGKRLHDDNPRLFNRGPEHEDDERPTLAEASLSLVRKQRSYDNRPGLRNVEDRSDKGNRRSFDNRPERFDSKRPSHENEPGSFVGKPRYYNNRPDFHDRQPASEDNNQRSFDNRPERFDGKRPSLDDELPSFNKKPRFYDNRPGIRDIKQRSENANQRSYDNRPERFDEKHLSHIDEPHSLVGKPKSYNNRPKIHDMEPKNRRSYDNRSPSFGRHQSTDGLQQSHVDKPRSYDNRPAFRNMNPRSVDFQFRANTLRSNEKPETVLKRKFQTGLKPLMGNKMRFPERKDRTRFSVPPKTVFKRKFQSGLKPLMGSKVHFPERKEPTRFSMPPKIGLKRKFQGGLKPLMGEKRPFPDASSKKLGTQVPNKRSIVIASKAVHNEVVESYVFATCSNEDILHKMVVFLIRMRMKKIVAAAGGSEMDPKTLVQKYRNRHPSVLDQIMAESISIRLDGESDLNKEAITLIEWKTLIQQFANVFPKVHLKLSPNKPTQKLEVGKQKIIKGKTAQVQSEVETQHPLTIDDIDSAIDTRTTDIRNMIFEVTQEDSTTDPVIEFVNRIIQEEGAEQLKILLTRTLSAALIRPDADEEFLVLRIHGNPKLPSLQQLEKWLKPYRVRQLKKTFKSKNLCIARVKDREAYDALLALDSPVVAGLPLTIKSSDITSPKMAKYLKKNKTWVTVVSKSEQQIREKKRLAKQNGNKAAVENKEP